MSISSLEHSSIVRTGATAAIVVLLGGWSATRSDPPEAVVTPASASPVVTTVPTSTPDPLQAEILADGRVTMAEMERALLAVVSCVKAKGFNAELTRFDLASGHTLSASSPSGDNAAANRTLTTCDQNVLSGVLGPFVRDNVPGRSEISAH